MCRSVEARSAPEHEGECVSILKKLRGSKHGAVVEATRPSTRRTLSGKVVSNDTPPPNGWGVVPGFRPKAVVPAEPDTSRRARRARARFVAGQRRKQSAVMTRNGRAALTARWNDPEWRAKQNAAYVETYTALVAMGTRPNRARMLAKRSVG
jgi:hypothetical protein